MRRYQRCVVLVWVAAGCADEARVQPQPALPSDTVMAEALAVIGEVRGTPEELFGDITSVAAGPGGMVYVADRIGSTVRAYDTSGQFVATQGSEGRGPGEFVWPNDLAFDSAGDLYARDAYRITVFTPQPGGAVADSVIRTVQLGGNASPWSARATIIGSLYYYPNYIFRRGERLRYFYEVYDSLGMTGDTVRVPSLPNQRFLGRASYLVSDQFGRMLNGVNRAPFEPAASWDLTRAGTILSSSGARNELVEWGSSNDTLRVISMGDRNHPVPEAEATDSAVAFEARLDSIPVPLDRVRGMSDAARNGRMPETLPEIVELQVDAVGNIWLRRWPPTGLMDRTIFDVLDESGTPLRTVVVPADISRDPPPFLSCDLIVGVLQDPVTHLERVGVFQLPETFPCR